MYDTVLFTISKSTVTKNVEVESSGKSHHREFFNLLHSTPSSLAYNNYFLYFYFLDKIST